VTEGPFAAFQAVVERAAREGRVRIDLDVFGRRTPIVIDERLLEVA